MLYSPPLQLVRNEAARVPESGKCAAEDLLLYSPPLQLVRNGAARGPESGKCAAEDLLLYSPPLQLGMRQLESQNLVNVLLRTFALLSTATVRNEAARVPESGEWV